MVNYICSKCKESYPTESFYHTGGRRQSHCKLCTCKQTAEYAQRKNQESGKTNRQHWYYKYRDKNLARMQVYRTGLRAKALHHYSNGNMCCECCGEKEPKFLALDHIVPVGRNRKMGLSLWLWLKKNNYPEGFRVLCHNCNLGRSLNGGLCPHKEIKSAAA